MIDDESMLILRHGDEPEICTLLSAFNANNAQTFHFPDLTEDLKQNFVQLLIEKLQNENLELAHVLCLETLRILSRDKSRLSSIVSSANIDAMLKHAGLLDKPCEELSDLKAVVEAQKCLCNLIYNSKEAQSICSNNYCVEGIVQRVKCYRDSRLSFDVKFFDMRMLFLVTALCADVRPKVRSDLHGATYLMEVLDLIINGEERESEGASSSERRVMPLSDQQADLACEILKVFFNLTVHVDKEVMDEEEEAHLIKLVSILHDILVCKTHSKEKKDELQHHTVNLLTAIPSQCYEELLVPIDESDVEGTNDVEYDGKNMESVNSMLEFLENCLDKSAEGKPRSSLKEALTPILGVLCEASKNNRHIRKFCRQQILPPLTDVMQLPQEGNTLRNKLCRLMTSPVTDVKDFVCELLFILCKENVQRLIKYTGYGNAAGLLAKRGLMLGGESNADYSSDSGESDTEEYEIARARINAVTGRYEDEKPDPWAGVTEEQKELETMQLVDMMEKLASRGIIQPMCIGSDGKPKSIDELTEDDVDE